MKSDTLYFYLCGRVCGSVTTKSIYTGRYERCRACGSFALYRFSRPVVTDEEKAVHAKGVALNPFPPTPVPWSCVRCGDDKTGQLREPCASGKGAVCRDCYRAEERPDVTVDVKAIDRRRLELEYRDQIEESALIEQSINQSTRQD